MAIASDLARTTLISRALWLEALAIVWMTIEAAVSVGSGMAAGSLSLIAFGVDSIIELASAVILMWRLTVELRQGDEFSEVIEQRARKIAGLAPLCASRLRRRQRRIWALAGSGPGALGSRHGRDASSNSGDVRPL